MDTSKISYFLILMSDFSFMKSGFGSISEQKDLLESFDMDFILIMLDLFTVNASKNALKYITIGGRNIVTVTDVKYGLIYEIFEFMKNPNILKDLEKMKEMRDLDEDDVTDDEDLEEEKIAKDEGDDFSRIEIDSVEKEEDKEFVTKMHEYHDTFPDWEPQNHIEHILKSATEKYF